MPDSPSPSARSRDTTARDFPSVVGGSHKNRYEDASVLSDDELSTGSHQSVATDALSTIMSRMETAKSQLAGSLSGGGSGSIQSKEDIESQVELAQLIEKLASAAVAVKQLDDL